MHIEKNFFKNIINTVMDVHGKTMDNAIDDEKDADDWVVMKSYVFEYFACQTIGCDFTYIVWMSFANYV